MAPRKRATAGGSEVTEKRVTRSRRGKGDSANDEDGKDDKKADVKQEEPPARKKRGGKNSRTTKPDEIIVKKEDDVKDDNTKDGKVPARKGRKRKADLKVTGTLDDGEKKEKISVKDEPGTATTSSMEEEEKGEMKKVKFTGSTPVDEHCTSCAAGYHVFFDGKDVFNAMLNQTNIGFNNNKYYLLQIIKHNRKPEYNVWFRWGRVGKIAGTTLKPFGANFHAAIYEFQKKFREKTGNNWNFRSSFTKVQGKYDLLEMDYGDDKEPEKKTEKKNKKPKKEIKSLLDERVGQVMDLIFDLKEFEASVREMEFDVKKAPLGKLTTKQIKAGYETLKKIESCITKKEFGRALSEACSEFYTRIPHDFGMKVPPLIRTPGELKKKIQLLEALSDIQIAIQLLDEEEEDTNLKDSHYHSLGCKLEPFDTDHDEFKLVQDYVDNTHGTTHSQYKLKVENVFKVSREEDEKRFTKNIGNKHLLWHGSRLTNWCGILNQGLRIAPPEAPVTGYMFGKGIYFADMVSKSANYCFANVRQPVGFLLLCEVALGNVVEKKTADYNASNLPKGKHSTKGVGREIPDPKGYKTLPCGTMVPMGKQKTAKMDTCLQYNEYIVYDVAQVKPRYLVQARFDFVSRW